LKAKSSELPSAGTLNSACAAALAFFTALACTHHLRPSAIEPELSAADKLFSAAQFAEARERYLAVANADASNFRASLRLGEIALLGNRLDDAQRWLVQASTLDPSSSEAMRLLAEAHYRSLAFDKSARCLRRVGSQVVASKLEYFASRPPYQVDGPQEIHVKFISTDPLPLLAVRVNRSAEVNFFIDTGASEIVVDPEFASEIGAMKFGTTEGTFAGDKKADVIQGAVDSIAIGEWQVRNVPIHLLATRRFSGILRGKRVDGIIGTRFLYQFISTIDYPNGELVLRQAKSSDLSNFRSQLDSSSIAVPFWLAGDHFIVAPGAVNGNPLILFVDTGLAGMGFTAPVSTLQAAAIDIPQGQAMEGLGGGGRVSAIPFIVHELALGGATAGNVQGLAGVFPASLENKFGFRIGGLISHAFFRPYSLTIDFARMRLYLTPQVEAVTNPAVSGCPLGEPTTTVSRLASMAPRPSTAAPK